MKILFAPLALLMLALTPVAAADCPDYFVPSGMESEMRCDPDGFCYRSFCPVFTYYHDCNPGYEARAFCT